VFAAAARKAPVRDTVEGVRAAGGRRDLRLIFGLGFAQAFVRGALNVLAIAVAFELLGTDDPGVATLWAAVGAGGVVGSFAVSLLVGSRHLGAWLGVALVLWGLPIAILGASSAGGPGRHGPGARGRRGGGRSAPRHLPARLGPRPEA
jgi:hypothetical protein